MKRNKRRPYLKQPCSTPPQLSCGMMDILDVFCTWAITEKGYQQVQQFKHDNPDFEIPERIRRLLLRAK